jgi:alanyl-tRNA synthetase
MRKPLIVQVGTTPKGHPVVSGIWRFRETYGVPLEVVVHRCAIAGAMVDWLTLRNEMQAAGLKATAINEQICQAAVEGYGLQVGSIVRERLHSDNKISHPDPQEK